jgi:hypothetical protein
LVTQESPLRRRLSRKRNPQKNSLCNQLLSGALKWLTRLLETYSRRMICKKLR